MMKNPPSKPFQWWILAAVLILQVISASGGGIVFIIAPDGSLMQMPLSNLDHSPFSNFLIPGLILLVVLGLFPAFVLWGLITKKQIKIAERLNIYNDRHWSWTFSIYVGIALMIWINTELLMLQAFDPLMAAYSLVGLAILILILTPGIQRYYKLP